MAFNDMVKELSLIALILFLIAQTTVAQRVVDSLESQIKARSGIEKFDPLIALARWHYPRGNYTEALKIVQEANKLALQSGDTVKIVMSSRIIGQTYGQLENYKMAETVLSKTLP